MYTPPHFRVDDTATAHEIIRRYSFATLITVVDGHPSISHLPFLFEADQSAHGKLVAHMARANPQWRSFPDGGKVTVVFQGPHAYVSPRWYAPEPDSVPTWNYAVVHCTGTPRILADDADAFEAQRKLVAAHDPEWTLDLPEKDKMEMLHAIVVFEIPVERMEAKFKLSQNRSAEDQANVARKLTEQGDDLGRYMAEIMRRIPASRR